MKRMLLLVTVAVVAVTMANCEFSLNKKKASAKVDPIPNLEHVHKEGCGHYFWHGNWHDKPHPADCKSKNWHP